MSRTGKISRLPSDIRETLNRRLDHGEPAHSILDWLNSDPSVAQILKNMFNASPISKCNLTHWRNGGYKDWKARQSTASFFERLHQTPTEKLIELQSGLIDQMAVLYASQLLAQMQNADAPADDAARAKMWREFRLAFASLRRYQFTTIVIQNKLKLAGIHPERSDSLALTEQSTRAQVESILGIAGLPDANRFDMRTQTWSGPQADAMNKQHRQLLLQAAQEAGLEISADNSSGRPSVGEPS